MGSGARGHADLPHIAAKLHMAVDGLLPVAEALQILLLAEMVGGDLKLTPLGKQFARA